MANQENQSMTSNAFHALVVLNTDFPDEPLLKSFPVPPEHENNLINALETARFNVTILKNVSTESFETEFVFFKEKCKNSTIIVLFVTHGLTVDQEPVVAMNDTRWLGENTGWVNTFKATEIGTKLRTSGAKNVLLILDACHQGFTDKTFPNTVEGFVEVENPPEFLIEPGKEEIIKGFYILTSTSPSEQANSEGQFLPVIASFLGGRKLVNKRGFVTASLLSAKAHIYLSILPHTQSWRMAGSKDFELSAQRWAVESGQLEEINDVTINTWRKQMEELLVELSVAVEYQLIYYDMLHVQDIVKPTVTKMANLEQRVREEFNGFDGGGYDYETPVRISDYSARWRFLTAELSNYNVAVINAIVFYHNQHLLGQITSQLHRLQLDIVPDLLEKIEEKNRSSAKSIPYCFIVGQTSIIRGIKEPLLRPGMNYEFVSVPVSREFALERTEVCEALSKIKPDQSKFLFAYIFPLIQWNLEATNTMVLEIIESLIDTGISQIGVAVAFKKAASFISVYHFCKRQEEELQQRASQKGSKLAILFGSEECWFTRGIINGLFGHRAEFELKGQKLCRITMDSLKKSADNCADCLMKQDLGKHTGCLLLGGVEKSGQFCLGIAEYCQDEIQDPTENIVEQTISRIGNEYSQQVHKRQTEKYEGEKYQGWTLSHTMVLEACKELKQWERIGIWSSDDISLLNEFAEKVLLNSESCTFGLWHLLGENGSVILWKLITIMREKLSETDDYGNNRYEHHEIWPLCDFDRVEILKFARNQEEEPKASEEKRIQDIKKQLESYWKKREIVPNIVILVSGIWEQKRFEDIRDYLSDKGARFKYVVISQIKPVLRLISNDNVTEIGPLSGVEKLVEDYFDETAVPREIEYVIALIDGRREFLVQLVDYFEFRLGKRKKVTCFDWECIETLLLREASAKIEAIDNRLTFIHNAIMNYSAIPDVSSARTLLKCFAAFDGIDCPLELLKLHARLTEDVDIDKVVELGVFQIVTDPKQKYEECLHITPFLKSVQYEPGRVFEKKELIDFAEQFRQWLINTLLVHTGEMDNMARKKFFDGKEVKESSEIVVSYSKVRWWWLAYKLQQRTQNLFDHPSAIEKWVADNIASIYRNCQAIDDLATLLVEAEYISWRVSLDHACRNEPTSILHDFEILLGTRHLLLPRAALHQFQFSKEPNTSIYMQKLVFQYRELYKVLRHVLTNIYDIKELGWQIVQHLIQYCSVEGIRSVFESFLRDRPSGIAKKYLEPMITGPRSFHDSRIYLDEIAEKPVKYEKGTRKTRNIKFVSLVKVGGKALSHEMEVDIDLIGKAMKELVPRELLGLRKDQKFNLYDPYRDGRPRSDSEALKPYRHLDEKAKVTFRPDVQHTKILYVIPAMEDDKNIGNPIPKDWDSFIEFAENLFPGFQLGDYDKNETIFPKHKHPIPFSMMVALAKDIIKGNVTATDINYWDNHSFELTYALKKVAEMERPVTQSKVADIVRASFHEELVANMWTTWIEGRELRSPFVPYNHWPPLPIVNYCCLEKQDAHESLISSLAAITVPGEGVYILSGGYENAPRVKQWSVNRPTSHMEQIGRDRHHTKPITSIAVGPSDNRIAASGDEEGILSTWSVTAGGLDDKRTFIAHSDQISDLFIAENDWIFTSSYDGQIKIWSPPGRDHRFTDSSELERIPEDFIDVGSPVMNFVVIYDSEDKFIEQDRRFIGLDEKKANIYIGPPSERIVAVGRNFSKIYHQDEKGKWISEDAPEGFLKPVGDKAVERIRGLVVTKDYSIVAAFDTRTIYLWNLGTGECRSERLQDLMKRYQADSRSPTPIAGASTASHGSGLFPGMGERIYDLRAFQEKVPGTNRYLVAGGFFSLYVFKLEVDWKKNEPIKCLTSFEADQYEIMSVAVFHSSLTGTGKVFAVTGSATGSLRIWEISTARKSRVEGSRQIISNKCRVTAMNLHPNGLTAVLARNILLKWDEHSENSERISIICQTSLRKTPPNKACSCVVEKEEGMRSQLWNSAPEGNRMNKHILADEKFVFKTDARISALAVILKDNKKLEDVEGCHDSVWIVTGDYDGNIRIFWDEKDESEFFEWEHFSFVDQDDCHEDEINSVVDLRYDRFATSSWDFTIKIWRIVRSEKNGQSYCSGLDCLASSSYTTWNRSLCHTMAVLDLVAYEDEWVDIGKPDEREKILNREKIPPDRYLVSVAIAVHVWIFRESACGDNNCTDTNHSRTHNLLYSIASLDCLYNVSLLRTFEDKKLLRGLWGLNADPASDPLDSEEEKSGTSIGGTADLHRKRTLCFVKGVSAWYIVTGDEAGVLKIWTFDHAAIVEGCNRWIPHRLDKSLLCDGHLLFVDLETKKMNLENELGKPLFPFSHYILQLHHKESSWIRSVVPAYNELRAKSLGRHNPVQRSGTVVVSRTHGNVCICNVEFPPQIIASISQESNIQRMMISPVSGVCILTGHMEHACHLVPLYPAERIDEDLDSDDESQEAPYRPRHHKKLSEARKSVVIKTNITTPILCLHKGDFKSQLESIRFEGVVNEKPFARAMILVPSKKYLKETHEIIQNYLFEKRERSIGILECIGGYNIGKERKHIVDLFKTQIIIGTPARIVDAMQWKLLRTTHIDYLVIRNCEEVLQKGNLDLVRIIYHEMPLNVDVSIHVGGTVSSDTSSDFLVLWDVFGGKESDIKM